MTSQTLHLYRTTARAPLQLLQRPLARAVPANVAAAGQPGWIDRLAAWADRQPPRHHRLGAWQLQR